MVERFFDEKIDWLKLSLAFIKSEMGEEVILVADETTVSKSGKSTFWLSYFYSGVTHSVIKSINFFGFSLIDVKTQRSFPLLMKQVVQKPKKEEKERKTAEKRKRGRPKGSKNKNSKATVEFEKLFLLVFTFLQIIKNHLKVPNLRYFVYDRIFGRVGTNLWFC